MSKKLACLCSDYVASDYRPGFTFGKFVGKTHNENLQQQTFRDASFDLVVTMDVFEHLPFPEKAFREIARTLKPGGAHIFTVPCDLTSNTVVRAELSRSGEIIHHKPAVYHGNPIDPKGSLVFRDWGHDLPKFIQEASGLKTQVVRIRNWWQGIEPVLNEVYISRKP